MCQGCIYQDNLETESHDRLGQCPGRVVVGTGMEETEMLW